MAQTDLFVLLPGISGSVLSKNGKEIWGTSASALLRVLTTGGDSIRSLMVAEDDPDVDDLGDGVTATRVVPDVHMIPGLWKIDGYTKVGEQLAKQLGLKPGKNFFEFPYDWRRDNRVSARKLARQVHDWLTAWRTESGSEKAKIVFIAHSMGGLVARYFIECLEGWRTTRLLVTFGTPYRGSMNALGFVANGFSKGIGPLRLDFSGTLRSFTAVYQLLPTYPCVDVGGASLLRVTDVAGVPNLDRRRAQAAADFHTCIEDAQASNAKLAAYASAPPKVYPVIGISQPTFLSAKLESGLVALLQTKSGDNVGGDGTVPLPSAIPKELDNQSVGMFVAEVHGSLQNADAVLTQVVGAVTAQAVKMSEWRAPVELVQLGLQLDDVYAALSPAVFRVHATDQGQSLHADIWHTDTGQRVVSVALKAEETGHHVGSFTLPEGIYRLQISGGPKVIPVTDCFAVISGEGRA